MSAHGRSNDGRTTVVGEHAGSWENVVDESSEGGTQASPSKAALSSAEMHPGPGFRVRHQGDRLPSDLVEAFGTFETPDVSDLLNRLYTMSVAIRPLTPETSRVAGLACTVKVFPGDNLMVHKALDLAGPGDVIVVDASASHMTAVLGDMIANKAAHRGIAGFVIDGLIRDLPGIREMGSMPVFARGVTPIGPLHRGPGEVNYPVSCGGIVVNPGDVIVGDDNGVVVVPQQVAKSTLDLLNERREREAGYVEAVKRGEFSNAWVDKVLAGGGMHLPRPGSPPEADGAARS